MYTIPSSPMPPNSFAANDVDESTDENSMAGLAKRVSAYLARVVGALADFEDQLLCEAGFFAREEHLEKHIHLLLREFESNRRAAVLFSRSDAVGLLIAQLVANPQVGSAGPDLHSRRQQQFVFAGWQNRPQRLPYHRHEGRLALGDRTFIQRGYGIFIQLL